MTTSLHRLDATLQQVCPTIMAPRFGSLEEMRGDSHRFIAGDDGLYLDVVRPWLRFRMLIAPSAIPMPYGAVSECSDLSLNGIEALLHRFIAESRTAFPNEHAAWFSFDLHHDALRYEPVQATIRNGAHIQYDRPRLLPNRRLAIDIHSHGRHGAGFSPTDDRDDATDDVKLAIVIGNLDKSRVSVAARLVAFGIIIDYTDFVAPLLEVSA